MTMYVLSPKYLERLLKRAILERGGSINIPMEVDNYIITIDTLDGGKTMTVTLGFVDEDNVGHA